MKTIFTLTLFVTMFSVVANIVDYNCLKKHVSITQYKSLHEYELNALLNAIKMVESKNGKYLNGKNGEFGPYQMKRIVIDDVNRILGTKIYKYEDAMDEQKSRDICEFYITYWAEKAGMKHDVEAMARIWNGGPKGYKKKSTIKYWNKIKEVLYVND